AKDNNYILLQSNEALTGPQQERLQGMEVQFQKYLGGDAGLCRYNPPNLQVLRDEPYIRDVALVPPQQKLDPVISELQTESGKPSEQITTVDVALHFKA